MTQKYIDKILVISIILILIIIIILLLIKNYGKNIKESFHNFTGYRYYKNNDLYNRLRNYYYTNPQYYDHRYIIDRWVSINITTIDISLIDTLQRFILHIW